MLNKVGSCLGVGVAGREGIDAEVGRCFEERLQLRIPVLQIHKREGQQYHMMSGTPYVPDTGHHLPKL